MSAFASSPLGARAPFGGRRFGYLANVVFYDEVSSTNDLAKSIAEPLLADGTEIPPTVIVARRQTAGRGRGSRSWVSAGNTGLSFSLILPWPEGPERVRLPLRLGVILARGLTRRYGVEIHLKWPNDLLAGRKKLAGSSSRRARARRARGTRSPGSVSTSPRPARRSTRPGSGRRRRWPTRARPRPALAGDAVLVAVLEELDAGLSAPAFDLPVAFAVVSAHREGERLTIVENGRQTVGTFLGVTAERLPPARHVGRRGDGGVGRHRLLLNR